MSDPLYLNACDTDSIDAPMKALYGKLSPCTLCPRECKVKRLESQVGFCKSTDDVKISSAMPHFGEEPELVGIGGSGTIFFAGCNLGCVFCQNADIAHQGYGENVSVMKLGRLMIHLQNCGCHNINVVTPTHFIPQIVEAVRVAAGFGLNIPLVYNCGGYESVKTLKLLDGIINIYMPDIKFGSNEAAQKYCGVTDYVERSQEALIEMHRQVGDLETNEKGIATRGVLVRHLVLPENAAYSEKVFSFIADKISENCYVNVMAQYKPYFNARQFPEISEPLRLLDYNKAVAQAKEAGLKRIK